MDEDLLLLGRLDWLRSLLHHAPPRQRVLLGEAPAVFLACALGMGTPEEAEERLPLILQPEAALALALWLQIRAQAFDAANIQCSWKGKCLEVTLASVNDADLTAWSRQYGEWVVESDPHRLLMQPGAFAPQVPLQQAEQR
jgi:hypothetical protein